MKKVDYRYIFLILILIFGFYLRVYHIDYPVVGYHNWKETHYLTEGRNFAEFGFFEDGFFVPRWNYPTLNDHSTGIHTDSFPLTSIILGGLFKIFGNNLTLARMISVLFSIGTILIIFLIIKKLFKRYDLAIISAFIFAINPLGVFFGRQVQLLSYSLFFCLLGILYYLKWIKNPSWKNTFLFSIPLILGILTKYSFVLFVFPILMTYPYRNLKSKKYLDKNIFFIFLGILSLIWFKYSSSISQEISEQFKIIDFGVLINLEFWSILYLFAKDNYTLIGTLFFILGVFFWFFIVNLNRKSFPYKFFSFYLIGSVIWFVFMSQKLQGHNYHQYPLLLLFVFFVSLSIISLATFISKLFDIKKLKNLLILICL